MENVLYIKHKFGILYYQNKLNKFKEKFELKDINDKYYKNNDCKSRREISCSNY